MTTAKVGNEPEPIEAEFEPLEGAELPPPRRAPRPMRSRAVTFPHLIAASLAAASLGAIIALAASNAGSGAPTGTLAREIDLLRRDIADLRSRTEQSTGEVIGLRSSFSAQGDRISRLDGAAGQLRDDVTALTNQISAISGASAGEAPDGALPANSPLGVLLARINRLEGIVAEDRYAPETTREVQRAIADLSDQVASLDRANTALVSAFDQRQAALAALEDGLLALAESGPTPRSTQAPHPTPAPSEPTAPVAEAPVMAAADRSRTIRALAALESAARSDRPFAREYVALVAYVPDDASLASIRSMADAGVPTVKQLRSDFDQAANRARKLAEQDSDDGWNWLRQSFAGVVDFPPSQLVTRNAETIRTARRQLDIGNIEGAAAAVASLSGKASGAFEVWRKQALTRAKVESALHKLNDRLLGAASAGVNAG